MAITSNTNAMDYLWEIVKPLYTEDEIEIFKEYMSEDVDSIPDSYILLRDDLNNSASFFGDGNGLLRGSDCDIILVSKGLADKSNCLHNTNKQKIISRLKELGIFEDVDINNLGYDDVGKYTQTTFSLTINYAN